MPGSQEKQDQFKALVDTVEKAEAQHEKADDKEKKTELEWGEKVQARIAKGQKAIEYTAGFMGDKKDKYKEKKLKAFEEKVATINTDLGGKLAVAKTEAEAVVEGILAEITGAVDIGAEDLKEVLKGEITEEKAKSLAENKEFFRESLGVGNTSDDQLKLEIAIAVGEGKGGIKEMLKTKSNRLMLQHYMVSPAVVPKKAVEANINFKAVYDILGISDPKSSPVAAMIENEISIANLFEDAQIQRIESVTGGQSRKGTDYKEVTDIAKYFKESDDAKATERKRRGLYTSESKYIPIFDGATIKFTKAETNTKLTTEGKARVDKPEPKKEVIKEPKKPEETESKIKTDPTKFNKLKEVKVKKMDQKRAEYIFNNLHEFMARENLVPFLEQAAAVAPWAMTNNWEDLQKIGRKIGNPKLAEDLQNMSNRQHKLQKALGNVLKIESLKGATSKRAAEIAALILNNLDLPILRNDERTTNLMVMAVKMKADLVLPNVKKMMAVDSEVTEDILKEILGVKHGVIDASDYSAPAHEIIKYSKDLIELGFEWAKEPIEKALAKELKANPARFLKEAVTLLETPNGREKISEFGYKNPLFILDNAEAFSGSRKGLKFLKKITDHAIAKEGVEAHKMIMKNVQSFRRLSDFKKIIKKAADETLKMAGGPKIIIENMDGIAGSFDNTEGFFAKAADMAAGHATMSGTVIMKNIDSIKKHIKESEKIIKKAAETMAVNNPLNLYIYAGNLDGYPWAKKLLKKARETEDKKGDQVDLASKNPSEILKSAKSLSERGRWGKNLLLDIAENSPEAVFMNSSEIARLDPKLKEKIYEKATKDKPELTIQYAELLYQYKGERWFKNRLAKVIKEKPEVLAKNAGKLRKYPRSTYIKALEKMLGENPKLIVENADQFLLLKEGEYIVEHAVKGNESELVKNLQKIKGLYDKPWVKDAVVKILIKKPELIIKYAGGLKIFIKNPDEAKTSKGKLAITRRNKWAQITVRRAMDKRQAEAKKNKKSLAEFDKKMTEDYFKKLDERKEKKSKLDAALTSREKAVK